MHHNYVRNKLLLDKNIFVVYTKEKGIQFKTPELI